MFRIRPTVQSPGPTTVSASTPGVYPKMSTFSLTGPTGPQGLAGESIEGVGISSILFENNTLSILLTDGSEYGFNIQDILAENMQGLVGPTGPPGDPVPTNDIWLKIGALDARIKALEARHPSTLHPATHPPPPPPPPISLHPDQE